MAQKQHRNTPHKAPAFHAPSIGKKHAAKITFFALNTIDICILQML